MILNCTLHFVKKIRALTYVSVSTIIRSIRLVSSNMYVARVFSLRRENLEWRKGICSECHVEVGVGGIIQMSRLWTAEQLRSALGDPVPEYPTNEALIYRDLPAGSQDRKST